MFIHTYSAHENGLASYGIFRARGNFVPRPNHPLSRACCWNSFEPVFRRQRQQESVLPLIETKGVPIGIWTRDAGIRVPKSTKWRLFRSVDRVRDVGYGTSRSTEQQSKFPIRPIFK